jgi:hypothetical protein
MSPSREEVCMTDAAPEPEGSEEEIKRKFREALERKRAKHADANAARGGKDAGPGAGVRFAARPAAERLTERINATAGRPPDERNSARIAIPVTK